MDAEAERGHLEILMWLSEHGYEGCTGSAPYFAAYYGHSRVVQWLHTHYPKEFEEEEVIFGAARHGHLEIVQWLNNNCIGGCAARAMGCAASNGHLDVVLYLLEHRNERFSGNAMTLARDIEVHCLFRYGLHQTGCRNPVKSNQLKILNAVYEQRPAFLQGCLRCLGEIAIRESNTEILDWLYPFGLELRKPFRDAVTRGDVKLLQWFHQNGFKVHGDDLLELAVQNGQLNIAHWLLKHGDEINSLGLVEVAGNRNNIHLLRFLIEQGPPLIFSIARTLTMKFGHVEIVSWVAECDRVQLVLEAMGGRRSRIVVVDSHFEDESSRWDIRGVLRQVRICGFKKFGVFWVFKRIGDTCERTWR